MKWIEAILIALAIFLVFFTFCFLASRVVDLGQENKILKEENHILETTLDDFGAKVEELSNTVERLMKDRGEVEDWNKETFR